MILLALLLIFSERNCIVFFCLEKSFTLLFLFRNYWTATLLVKMRRRFLFWQVWFWLISGLSELTVFVLQAESTFSEEEEEKLQIAFSLEKQDLHLVLETISFILEQAVYHNLKPASLQQQLQSIHLDQDKAEAFASAWAAAGQDTIEKFRQRVLNPQKLETIGWQLNLQLAESMQAKLKSPRAVLELGVNNEDSKV
ncbi:COMM domain-containing protein 10 isoform 4-T4 [Amazona ochrocephala]